MKLLFLETDTGLAVVECECGGRALVLTKDATEAKPRKVICQLCLRTFLYPNDLET